MPPSRAATRSSSTAVVEERVAALEGDLAKQIVEAARAYGVPVLRDVPLARALMELEVGAEIPEELYEAVAAQ